MSVMERKHVGARNEMLATAWLLKQGYEVFRNVSQHGMIDLVCMKDGNVTFFDVKGARKNLGGTYRRSLSAEQAKAGISLLAVLDDDSCEIVDDELSARRFVEKDCAKCGRQFTTSNDNKRFCSSGCRNSQKAKTYKDKQKTAGEFSCCETTIADNDNWKCPINKAGCASNCGDYGCGN